MAQPIIQHSFNSGEWAPALNARVDLQKYHSGAALLRNFFVDYRGGASSRAGTKYVLQCYKSATAVRLIPFQASFTVNYVLEFGDHYIRFFFNGAPILETGINITGVSGNTITAANSYSAGDWVFVTGVNGITNINGKYFIVASATGTNFTVTDLVGGAVTFAGTWTSGGTTARVYTIGSPYAAADIALLKYAQNVNTLIICHPSYPPAILTLVNATNWTLNNINFGSTVAAPTGVGVATTLSAGTVNYAYVVTAVDHDGQESIASSVAALASKTDLRTVAGTNTISWTAVSGAVSYNVYKSELSYAGAVPTGSTFGFIGNCSGINFIDSNIAPDFTQSLPIPKNPFSGAGIDSITITNAGSYTTVPTVTIADAPSGGLTATASVVLGVTIATVNNGGSGFSVNDVLIPQISSFAPSVVLKVTSIGGGGAITGLAIVAPGSITSGSTHLNPITFVKGANPMLADLTWGVISCPIIQPGAGYTSVPGVTFSAGAAAGTAVLGTISAGNPSVPIYFQQRLTLAGPPGSPQQFNMSQPGGYFNFNISDPIQADDAIEGTLVSNQLNTIKALVVMSTGLIMFGDKQAWLVNGGGGNIPITPIDATANSQAYNGATDVPPIVSNYDILYVQAKNSIVRDLTFNFYTNIYTGTDISILSSHLFYGYTIVGWAWAEEPFKIVWAVRSDGALLALTFLKEQELIAWTHSDTDGLFKSVTTVTETTQTAGAVDATYFVVQRVINGNTVQYIERMAERIFPNGAADAWCVDAGLQYSGSPASSFTGGEHLVGKTIVGLADGVPITPFVMPASGAFTLPSPASKVTVGLSFTPQLQTLQLDLGEPTIQGKRKKITAVTVRCQETLGLTIGSSFTNGVVMKDLVLGNVGSATDSIVTGLVTADARTVIDPVWQVPGQYCIQQPQPLPASVLGVIPEITIGDTPK